METKKQHGKRTIQFSAIRPLELWKKLGLEQLSEPSTVQEPTRPTRFDSEESKRAYEVFIRDFASETTALQDPTLISSEKGSIFIWSLLKEESEHCPKPKLSSKKILFKDNLFKRICRKTKDCCGSSKFSDRDFEDIVLYLENKWLIAHLSGEIRTTQHFRDLFHEKYNAWLVF